MSSLKENDMTNLKEPPRVEEPLVEDEKMKSQTQYNGKKRKSYLLAPITLLGYERIYWLWIVMMFFSFLGVWISFLNSEFSKPFTDGTFYCTFITIMCPYVLEFFVELKVKKKSNIKQKFIYYKIASVVVAFVYIFVSGLIMDKTLAKIPVFQGVYIGLSVLITLYIYLVFKMDNHPAFLREFMDGTYAENEKDDVNGLIAKASSTTNATVKGRSLDI